MKTADIHVRSAKRGAGKRSAIGGGSAVRKRRAASGMSATAAVRNRCATSAVACERPAVRAVACERPAVRGTSANAATRNRRATSAAEPVVHGKHARTIKWSLTRIVLAVMVFGVLLSSTLLEASAVDGPGATDLAETSGQATAGQATIAEQATTAEQTGTGEQAATDPLASFGQAVDGQSSGKSSASAAASGSDKSSATAQNSATSAKDETLYIMLDGSGKADKVLAVNHFKLEADATIKDLGRYSGVTNLTNSNDISNTAGQIHVDAKKGDFYYQGELSDTALPWIIDITYMLDGRKCDASDLADASGTLEISISISQNTTVDASFFDNYLMQVQLTMSLEKVKNISATDATIASAGKNEQVVFTVMPGKESNLKLSADVTNFEMPAIAFTAMPMSMAFGDIDTGALTQDMGDLSGAIEQLNDGIGELESGMSVLNSGTAQIASGAGEIGNGLSALNDNSTLLASASTKINGALQTISQELQNGTANLDPAQIEQLSLGLRTLASALYNSDIAQQSLGTGLEQIKGGVQNSVSYMDGAISALGIVDAASIVELSSDPALATMSPTSQAALTALIALNTQAAILMGTWYGPNGNDGVKAGLTSAVTSLETELIPSTKQMSESLLAIADGLDANMQSLTGLGELSGYISQLALEYSSFNNGLAKYSQGMNTMSDSYSAFSSGLSELANGSNALYGGMQTLHDGSTELFVNTQDLPQKMQEEIDKFLAEYQWQDFKPHSFVDEKNTACERVQFVMQTEAIEIAEPAVEDLEKDAPNEEGFFDRLGSLFGQ